MLVKEDTFSKAGKEVDPKNGFRCEFIEWLVSGSRFVISRAL